MYWDNTRVGLRQNKLKSLKVAQVKDELGGDEDDGCDVDFKLLGGFGDWWTNKLTDIGGCRVAFVTENWY